MAELSFGTHRSMHVQDRAGTGKPLLIFGLGELPDQAHYYFEQHAGRKVEAFTVDPEYLGAVRADGLPVLPFDEAQRRFPPATHDLFVAIGYSQFNRVRQQVVARALALGYALPSFVHESAVVASNVPIGVNCMLREQVTAAPFARLGDGVIVGPQAMIAHHARIENHVWLAACSVICGSANIGERCFVGANATVRDKISVGAGCIVGAGAIIMSDCPPDGVYAATPTPRRVKT
jgi:sugar O-acyltransferase (sialic acid O-acetyltransferase NeuD family)